MYISACKGGWKKHTDVSLLLKWIASILHLYRGDKSCFKKKLFVPAHLIVIDVTFLFRSLNRVQKRIQVNVK